MDIDFFIAISFRDKTDATNRRFLRAETEADLKVWKRGVIEVLKDSASKDRKFLRWRVYGGICNPGSALLEEGELEVLPGVLL